MNRVQVSIQGELLLLQELVCVEARRVYRLQRYFLGSNLLIFLIGVNQVLPSIIGDSFTKLVIVEVSS